MARGAWDGSNRHMSLQAQPILMDFYDRDTIDEISDRGRPRRRSWRHPQGVSMAAGRGDPASDQVFVQIWATAIEVDGEKDFQAEGRTDILVRWNETPLAALEIKRKGSALTEADVEQGLSYASVIRPRFRS